VLKAQQASRLVLAGRPQTAQSKISLILFRQMLLPYFMRKASRRLEPLNHEASASEWHLSLSPL